MTINFYKLSANVIISLREIIDIANNLIAMIDKNHLQMLEFFKL
jgi:hypothetical protein